MRWVVLALWAGCVWGLVQCDTGSRGTQQRLILWRGGPLPPRVTGRPPTPPTPRKVPEEAGPPTVRLRQPPKTRPIPRPTRASEQCVVNGLVLYQGAVWSPRPCTVCACERGAAVCEDIECPQTECGRTRRPPGQCCPVCVAETVAGDTASVSRGIEAAREGNRERNAASRKEGRRRAKDGRKSRDGLTRASAWDTGRLVLPPERAGGHKPEKNTPKRELAVVKQILRKRPQLDLQQQGAPFRTQGLGPKTQEVGLKKQEVGLKKEEVGAKKQEDGAKKQEGGLKKQEVGVKKPEVGVKKAAVVADAGVKIQDVGLRRQEVGAKRPEPVVTKPGAGPRKTAEVVAEAGAKAKEVGLRKQEVGVKKQEVGIKKQEVGLKKPQVAAKKPEVARKVGNRREEANSDGGDEGARVARGGSAKTQELLAKKQGVGPGAAARMEEAAPAKQGGGPKRWPEAAGTRAGAGSSRPEAGGGGAAATAEKLPRRASGARKGAPSVPFPQELLPPPESEFNMPSLPVGCILAESAIACPASKLTAIPTLLDPGLNTLYLADNDITTISAADFAGLPNLQWLDLSRNKVSDEGLDPDAFRNLTRLRRLNLDGNLIGRLPRLPSSLEELKVNDNRLEVTDRNSFRGLHRLLTLQLEGNGLDDGNFNPTSFGPLKKLIYLRLGRNRFRAMPSGLPSSLQELHLENNHIEEVPGGLLNKTLNLTLLVLRNNRIQENRIAPRAWIHLRKLESLDLSHNRLVHVPSFLPTGVKQLLLHHNQIERIPGYVFAHLRPGLEFLHLSYNRLRDDGIHGVSFLGLYRTLQELLLDHNQLRAVPRGILNLRALQVLRLSDNQIRYVPLDSVCDTRISEDSNLVSIHLENNLIDRRLIPPNAFSCIRSYQSIVVRPQRYED